MSRRDQTQEESRRRSALLLSKCLKIRALSGSTPYLQVPVARASAAGSANIAIVVSRAMSLSLNMAVMAGSSAPAAVVPPEARGWPKGVVVGVVALGRRAGVVAIGVLGPVAGCLRAGGGREDRDRGDRDGELGLDAGHCWASLRGGVVDMAEDAGRRSTTAQHCLNSVLRRVLLTRRRRWAGVYWRRA